MHRKLGARSAAQHTARAKKKPSVNGQTNHHAGGFVVADRARHRPELRLTTDKRFPLSLKSESDGDTCPLICGV